MRLNGQEVFTRQTTASWRNVLLTSFGVIIVQWYGYGADGWVALGQSINPDDFRQIASLTLVFLSVIHFANWWSDCASFQYWFKKNSEQNQGLAGYGKKDNELPLSLLVRRFAKLERHVEKIEEIVRQPLPEVSSLSDARKVSPLIAINSKLNRIQTEYVDLAADVQGVLNVAESVGPNFKYVSLIAKLQLYGVYLSTPILVSLYAVYLLHFT